MKRLLSLIAACLAVAVGAGACLVDRAIHRPRTALTADNHARAADLATSLGAVLETVSVTAGDGATLQGWLFTPGNSNGDTVMLLHGITSNRAGMLPRARALLERGYRALALDGRGHGDSGGDLVTFGALESGDMRGWIAWVRQRATNGCVFLLGDSLGAAVALQSADAPGVCGVIAQSAFANMREIAFDRVGQQLRTGAWVGRSVLRPGIEAGLLYARVRYGVDLGAASALAAVSRPGAPVLVIHGELDDNAPARHARMLGQANPSRVTTWIVPGGAHGGFGAGEPDYDTRLFEFLARTRKTG
ncbi:MAG: alpha/beta fold hydrolase [Vicinamibacterales bacterium]